MAIGKFMEQSLQITLSYITNQGQFPYVFLRAFINSSSVTGALTDPELDGSSSGATFSIGLAWLIWGLVMSVFAFPIGNDTDCFTGAEESLVFWMAAQHLQVWPWGGVKGAQWQHSSLVRTGTARAIQQIETVQKSSSVKSLSGKDLWRQIQESSVQSELLCAPSPRAVFTATVQPWISALWFPPGVLSCTPRRGKVAGFVLPGNSQLGSDCVLWSNQHVRTA